MGREQYYEVCRTILCTVEWDDRVVTVTPPIYFDSDELILHAPYTYYEVYCIVARIPEAT